MATAKLIPLTVEKNGSGKEEACLAILNVIACGC
jgi:hypothetical protein